MIKTLISSKWFVYILSGAAIDQLESVRKIIVEKLPLDW